MSKSKVNEIDSGSEVLDKLGGSAKNESGVKIPFLAMNIASENEDGVEIPVKTFNIVGTDSYSKTVRFRPISYVNKLIAMKQEGTAWKTTNETIFYGVGEQPLDARGGIACGRLLGKAIPENYTEEQKKANKAKANYYGFLFGLVEFPGQQAALCSFRVPAGKAVQVANVLQDLNKHHGKHRQYMLNMKLSTNSKDKSSPHPVLEIEPDLSTKLPDTGLKEAATVINDFINQHNTRIRTSHQNAKLARGSAIADTKLVSEIMDDEIPF